MHNSASLDGISAASFSFPGVPQVAVFDTAFHAASMPDRAARYAIPEWLAEEHGVRRYGFHGTSHRYAYQVRDSTNSKRTMLDTELLEPTIGGEGENGEKDGEAVARYEFHHKISDQ